MMSVVNNLSAMNAQRQYNLVTSDYSKSAEKLSSGYRINRAADDAAGLTISEKMRSKIRALNQGSDNIQDGISMMQVADGALAEVNDMLHRMNELAIKSANGTNTSADRSAIQKEVDQVIDEIDRIGESTEFNTLKLFSRKAIEEETGGKITKLVGCPSAEKKYLGEYYQVGSQYHPAASMDFSNINEKTLKYLDKAYFSFTCSASCSEAFKITFKTDGTASTGPTNYGSSSLHEYVIDISKAKSGTDVVSSVMNYIEKNPARSGTSSIPGALVVSHSNSLVAGGSKLTLIANSSYNTKEGAMNAYPSSIVGMGAVDCSSLDVDIDPEMVREYRIQCSNNVEDYEIIKTRLMDAKEIGVRPFDVSTESAAKDSIGKVDTALAKISSDRSEYGAYQNRLEHSYANNENKAENLTAAESAIRDTDMASEMVRLASLNILSQAGTSMMAQANQSTQNVLSLLQ